MVELCPTCRKPYKKPTLGYKCSCGDPFHNCRDCVWRDGKRIRLCHDCEILEKLAKANEE